VDAQDVINLTRQLLNDPINTGRWSDAALLTFVDSANQDLGRDVRYPEGRLTGATLPNQQEYSLPFQIIKYYRVYLAGQLIVPTSIDTLEGRQIGLFDQGLNAGNPYGTLPPSQPTGSGGPPGTQGTYTPAWNVQQPESYPVANVWGLPAPDAQPWTVGQRPRYYTRSSGTVIGIVPAPLAAVDLVIEGMFVPMQVTTTTQVLPYAWNYIRALAWKTCEYAYFSDNSDRSTQQYMYAAQCYEREMRKLRSDLRQADRQNRGPKLLTYRSFYQLGNNRNCRGPNYG